MHATNWRKSRYSGDESNCVEVAIERSVGVRDTKERESGQLTVSRRAWSAVLEQLR